MTAVTVRLGDCLKKSVLIERLDPEREYKEVTVRIWGKGLTLRRVVRGAEIAADRRTVVRTGQLLLSRIDARHGAFGIVPSSLDGAVVSNDFPAFDIDATAIDPSFLAWLTKTKSFVTACARASEGTTNRVRLKEQALLDVPLRLPGLRAQRETAASVQAFAEAHDAACAALAEAQRDVDAARRSLFGSAFGRTRTPRRTIEDVCVAIIDNLHSNPVYAEDGSVSCVRSPDVGWGTLNLSSALRTDEAEFVRRTVRGVPSPGDLVFVREGGGTGKCAVVDEGQRFSLGQRVMMLRPNTTAILSRFLLFQLLSPAVQDEQIAPLTTGSAAPHLNIAALRRFDIFVPSLPEQQALLVDVEAFERHRADALRELRDAVVDVEAALKAMLNRAFDGVLLA